MSRTKRDADDDYQAYLDAYAGPRPVRARRRQGQRFVLFGFGRTVFLLSLLWKFQRAILLMVGLAVALVAASFLVPPLIGWLAETAVLWPAFVFAVLASAAKLTGDRVDPREYFARLRTVAGVNRDLVGKGAVASGSIGLAVGITALVLDGASVLDALDLAVGGATALLVAVLGVLEVATRSGGPRLAAALDASPRATAPDGGRAVRLLDAPGPRSAANRKQDPR